MAEILSSFRNYLVAQGVVRVPSVAGVLPPMHLEPLEGVPAPGEKQPPERGDTIVLGAVRASGIASKAYESMYRSNFVDVYFRTRDARDAWSVERQIRDLVVDKRQWTMATFAVLESLEWRAMQRVSSDTQGYLHTVGYVFYHSRAAEG